MSDWLHISRSEGCGNYTITITADTNEELTERLNAVIVSGKTKSISAMTNIAQAAQVTYTRIDFNSLTWVTDIAASGGTATKANCSYRVIGTKSDGTTSDVTSLASVSGSLTVTGSTSTSRHSVGTLTLTATMGALSCNGSVDAYQAAFVKEITGITWSALTWNTDVPASGGTATKANCSYYIIGHYNDSSTKNVTSASTISGSLTVSASSATTRHSVGTLTLSATCSGLSATSSVEAYQAKYVEPAEGYMSFTTECAVTVTFKNQNGQNLEYSFDKSTWTTWSSVVSISPDTNPILYLRGKNPNGWRTSACTSDPQFTFNLYTPCVTVGGNVMALIDYENPPLDIPSDRCFEGLFWGGFAVKAINKDFLPATALTSNCYETMFSLCKFTEAPTLPATVLAHECYIQMFTFTNIKSIELPATTLADSCYYGMFQECSALTSITCYATDISANECTESWVDNKTPSSGTFKGHSSAGWTTGTSGIPSGWTFEEIT